VGLFRALPFSGGRWVGCGRRLVLGSLVVTLQLREKRLNMYRIGNEDKGV